MKWFKQTSAPTLFFHTNLNERCSVYRLYEELRSRKRGLFGRWWKNAHGYLIREFYSSYAGFAEANSVGRPFPDRMIVFAYSHHHLPVLLSAISSKFIEHSWFNHGNRKCISVFFVSGGASLLNKRSWSSTFEHWIAFSKFDFLIDLPISQKECAIIYPALFSAVQDNQSVYGIKEAFLATYNESLKRVALEKTGNVEDMRLTAIKIISNISSLEYK